MLVPIRFMPIRPLLEICVDPVEHTAAAERGSADRIDLCADLAVDRVTSSADMMRAARPVHRSIIGTVLNFTLRTMSNHPAVAVDSEDLRLSR